MERTNAGGNSRTLPATGDRSPYTVLVTADSDAPVVYLERVHRSPAGKDLKVTADVRDPSRVRWVRLRYRHLTQFEDYQTAEMTRDPSTGLWHATIPASFVGREWDLMYYLEAMDTAGNGCMAPDLETEMPYVVVSVVR